MAFITAIVLWSISIERATAAENICPKGNHSPLETTLKEKLGDEYGSTILTYEGCAEEMGAWYMLPMPEKEDRMQAVHTILLPSNKVLVASGSSNRNRVDEDGVIQDNINTRDYDVVDNTNIFDPSLSDPFYKEGDVNPDFDSNPFERIDSPITPVEDNEPNDLFCSGHLHLPDGNVMFAGGTRLYYPGVKFQGSKFVNVFDWEKEMWDETPEGTHFHTMEDGRWYPTLIPLSDGAIAIISGLPADKFNEVNSIIEIYDPNLTGDKEWQAIDIREKENSPFQTQIRDDSYTPDYIDLYPRIFPVKKAEGDTFLITGNGGGKDTLPKHMSFNSYFMTFEKDIFDNYDITFESGPQRKGVTKVYGTASLDPTSENGDVLLYGGLIGANDISFGPGKYAIEGASASADVERWNAPDTFDPSSKKGYWKLYEDYLAHIDEDILQKTVPNSYPPEYKYEKKSSDLGRYGTRAMELAVILPTEQIIVVNGGNYAEHRPVFNPTLMTPDGSPDGFSTKLMNPDEEARMYHNTALLLPDARVLVMGGNPSRAARYEDGTLETATIRDFEFAPKGTHFLSAEVYRHAIFYPPYLFGSSTRPEILNANEREKLKYGSTDNMIEVTNREAGGKESLVLIKLGSVTHSFDSGQRLEELDMEIGSVEDGQTEIKFTAPSRSVFTPPGYYMLFYVNGSGMPSHAKIFHLDD
ncbi:galactose oxidase early set domain-containing protein [Dapis sp. BLCC M172]|uniref:galactose oxidase early set domain-containing protein n=1 Tax=Dapis sp. BLCC M172 TaxID=2975281 RepID=UPI003CEC9060